MKKLLFLSVMTILGATAIITTPSCKDPCKSTACGAGVCIEGKCECPAGYSDPNCSTMWSSKFLGDWSVKQYDDIRYQHTITFKSTNDVNIILLDKFLANNFNNIICELVTENTFKLQENQPLLNSLIIISGEGAIDESGMITLEMKYKYIHGTQIITSSAKGYKM